MGPSPERRNSPHCQSPNPQAWRRVRGLGRVQTARLEECGRPGGCTGGFQDFMLCLFLSTPSMVMIRLTTTQWFQSSDKAKQPCIFFVMQLGRRVPRIFLFVPENRVEHKINSCFILTDMFLAANVRRRHEKRWNRLTACLTNAGVAYQRRKST